MKKLPFTSLIILLVIAFCLPLFIFGQAPGGVSSNLTFWLKADNAASITGSPVQAWKTSGGSATNYSVTQATAANRPTLLDGATNYTNCNYNPRVKFTQALSTKLYNTATTPDLMGSNGTAIVVITQTTTSSFTYYSGTTGRYQLKSDFRFQTGLGGTGYTFDWGAPTEYPKTSLSMLCSYGCASNMSLRKNSVQTNSANNTAALYNPAISSGLYLGGNNTSEFSNASIAEVILFNAKPVIADMDRIESYLAIKYGITRGGNTGTSSIYNYVASTGTTNTIWDKTANAGYNGDIAGIGRDDNSGLNQKQSISANNGEALTIALGNTLIPTENSTNINTFASDLNFLVWGNNGLTKTFNTAANKPGGIVERLDRVWKLQNTGLSQQVTFGFETAQIASLGSVGALCLMFDDDGDFSNASVIGACSATTSATRVEFVGITLPVGLPYVTLARIQLPTFANNNGPICEGATLSLTAELIGGNTYAWTGPNSFTAAVQNPSITPATLNADGVYSVTVNSYGCLTDFTTTAVINSTVNPAANISASTNTICEGTSVTFTVNPTNGGSNPTLEWQLNGNTVSSATVFSSNSLNNGDVIILELISNATCIGNPTVTSNAITMLVTNTVVPSVTNVASSNGICAGSNVNFTATPVNGGSAPVYQWLINGANAGTGSVFSTSSLNNGDQVSVVLTSNANCAIPSSANSNTISIAVTPTVAPSVLNTASATTICSGDSVIFIALPTNGGTAPAFQWQINGANVGVNSATMITTSLNNGDIVSVTLSSNAICAVPATVNSNGIAIGVTPNPIAAFSYLPTDPNTSNPTVVFQDQSTNATSWNWSFDAGTNSTDQNPTYTFAGVGVYTVTLIAANGACFSTVTHTITVSDVGSYYVPNAFSPNGDNVNDTFHLAGEGILDDEFEMLVYNRWGQLIFNSDKSSDGWDGKTKGGDDAPIGVYAFVFKFKLLGSQEVIKEVGNVHLFR